MAAHSSILAWRIPQTEEPGGLQSIGSHSQTQLKRLSTQPCQQWGKGSKEVSLCLQNAQVPVQLKKSLNSWACTPFPGDSVVENSPSSAGDARDTGSVPGLGRLPGEGHCNPFQYSCLGNPMDSGAWHATVHGVTKSQTRLVTEHTHVGACCPRKD